MTDYATQEKRIWLRQHKKRNELMQAISVSGLAAFLIMLIM